MKTTQLHKQKAAEAALAFIRPGTVLGIGSGSTVDCFIEQLSPYKHKIEGVVAASKNSTNQLKKMGLEVLDLNSVTEIPVYVDGADEITAQMQMIKGGGAALTREKIIASVAEKFVCIATANKIVDVLGAFPLPIEVIPMARSYVARQLVKLGGSPEYRQGVVTDNGNVILDVYHLNVTDAATLESDINNIAGVVCNGLFAHRRADVLLLADDSGVRELS